MTLIDGIAASQNIDSSGERISIEGMDISSLTLDGTFTHEHEQGKLPSGEKITVKLPEQTVGKILKAKKIFSEKDATDERELYFWNKCKVPYIYVMGELFDDYTDAAKDLAGKFRYDADRKGQNERTVMNFSIEGSYIAKKKSDVTRSVARKVTITTFPCNKVAVAEIVPNKKDDKDDISSLFKTENSFEIELFKEVSVIPQEDDMKKHADILGIEPMEKSLSTKTLTTNAAVAPKTPLAPAQSTLSSKTTNPGTHLGKTKSGKNIFSHAKIHDYTGLSAQDHNEAANMHHKAASAAKDPALGQHHLSKMKLHMQAAKTAEAKASRFDRGVAQHSAQNAAKLGLNKSLSAGSSMAAPSSLVGDTALAKEDLEKKLVRSEENSYSLYNAPDLKPGEAYHIASHSPSTGALHYKGKVSSRKGLRSAADRRDQKHGSIMQHRITIVPSKALEKAERAEEEYANWDRREAFREFMQIRLPNLVMGEIDAIGRAIALKKSLDAESELSKLIKK